MAVVAPPLDGNAWGMAGMAAGPVEDQREAE